MKNEPIYILLADDDEDDRLIFSDALNEIKMNTIVNTVNDGQELLNYLNKDGVVMPNVLFLDLNMPRMNGKDCLSEIKKMSKLKDIAIAIYSTSGAEQDIEDTFINGANVFIKKPSDFGTLKKILKQVITLNWQYQTSGLNRDNFFLSI